MCIHGSIDGFSRCIIYLVVHNNNRASTVLTSFQLATNEWGAPSQVWAANGGQNVAVRDFMVWFQGENRGSFLTGPSTQNTRIEHLWRCRGKCCHWFRVRVRDRATVDTFWNLRVSTICWRCTLPSFPGVQRLLDRFTQRFNFHSDLTEWNRTPWQLWASRCLKNYNSLNAGIRDVLDNDKSITGDMDMYRHDPDAPLHDPQEDEEGMVIANKDFELSDEAKVALTQNTTLVMVSGQRAWWPRFLLALLTWDNFLLFLT